MSASIISNAKLQDDMSSIPLADDDPQGKQHNHNICVHIFISWCHFHDLD